MPSSRSQRAGTMSQEKGPRTAGLRKLARPAGFEPTTPWFVARYSIQLSYGREPQIISVQAFSPPPAPSFAAGNAPSTTGTCDRRLSATAFAVHAMPSHAQMNASGHASTRGHNAAITAIVNTSALTRSKRPASAGPSVRRFVIAAPKALPTLTAPAAARLALPESDRLEAGRRSPSRTGE